MSNIIKPIELPQVYDLSRPKDLPDLAKFQVLPINVSTNYWSHENKIGSYFEGFFQGIAMSAYEDKELECAFFMIKDKNGNITTVRNGSTKLVGDLKQGMASGKVFVGLPMRIEYMGKSKKTTRKGHNYDEWFIGIMSE
jgi:hypothetical protein